MCQPFIYTTYMRTKRAEGAEEKRGGRGKRGFAIAGTAGPLNFIRLFRIRGPGPRYCPLPRFNIRRRSIKFLPFASPFAPGLDSTRSISRTHNATPARYNVIKGKQINFNTIRGIYHFKEYRDDISSTISRFAGNFLTALFGR